MDTVSADYDPFQGKTTCDPDSPEPKAEWHSLAQRVHVARLYILRAQRGSHIITLGPRYVKCTYMDPFLAPS